MAPPTVASVELQLGNCWHHPGLLELFAIPPVPMLLLVDLEKRRRQHQYHRRDLDLDLDLSMLGMG